jgi:prevent-host-death family protein
MNMEVGIRDAKNSLSKLIEAVLKGEEVFLTNRGKRVVMLVPTPKGRSGIRGRGFLKGKVNLYPGWDSPEEDKKIEDMFEFLKETDSE